MNTYQTIEAAQADYQAPACKAIAEIEHKQAGRCYVILRCEYATLINAIKRNKAPCEIVRVIGCARDDEAAERAARKVAAEARQARYGAYENLVSALEQAEYNVRIHGGGQDGTGRNYSRLATAKQRLADYRAAHPEIAAEMDAERAAESAQREAEKEADYRSSWIARGLD